MRPGDRIEVGTPTGTFSADEAMGGRHLCIAAGSGITPMISVAGTVLRHPDAHVTLLYGNRTTGSVMFAEDLGDLKNRYGPRLQLVHVLSREPRDVELFSGRLDADRIRRLVDLLAPAETIDHVWLCGPFAMINDARAVLDELGIPAERIHFELFYVDEPPPELHREDPAIEGETSDVTRRARRAVGHRADAAQPSRSSTPPRPRAPTCPFACKGGVCGTCRARVTDGEVDMRRNYALEAAEVDAGFVLTCQSYAVSDSRHRRLRRLSATSALSYGPSSRRESALSSTVSRRESALRRPARVGCAIVGPASSSAQARPGSAASRD